MRYLPYKRRFNPLHKQSRVKVFIASTRNYSSSAKRLNTRYFKFKLYFTEYVRWAWFNSREKFYPRQSIRDLNLNRRNRGSIMFSYTTIKQMRAITIYSEDLV